MTSFATIRCRDRAAGFDVSAERHLNEGPTQEEHPMKYLLMIYGNDELWSSFPEEDMQKVVAETDAQNTELFASGELIGAYGVADQAMAKTVQLVDGQRVVTDGPYLEAKEYLGSFDIVDCESEERAYEIAADMPFARYGKVEVRPLMHEAAQDM